MKLISILCLTSVLIFQSSIATENPSFRGFSQISTLGKKNSKGVDFRFIIPNQMVEVPFELDNLVLNYAVPDLNIQVFVHDGETFFSRKESRKTFSKDIYLRNHCESYGKLSKSQKVISFKLTTVASYPAIECVMERMLDTSVPQLIQSKSWMILYEDKYITLQAITTDKSTFQAVEAVLDIMAASSFISSGD